MAAQRAAGEMDFATLNEQLRPSALRPALPPAANAALVALMQNISSAAATISIVNLMARSLLDYRNIKLSRHRVFRSHHITRPGAQIPANRPSHCVKAMHALHKRGPRQVSVPAQGAYHSPGRK